uniref:Minor capsid protein n=1 Tax=Siphoviridae sp. ct87j35 TaxID=2825356 RepID=A0A8S5V4L2_9CAUD|nr:MAG TPA: Minor capsid protein [Siphoviridae sp. ct87j35]
MSDRFLVDVRSTDDYTFYYNMLKRVNQHVINIVDSKVLANRPMARDNYIEETGIMGSYNLQSHDVEYALASQMAGITAGINRELAEQVLERALYYCPVDTGYLRSTGHIEENENGSCSVVFDCPYAWYVHEFTWREHDFPTRSHFLIQAVYEIEKEQGWWA